MGMKWLYICLGILGALAPAGLFYAVNYERKIPGTVIDLGLLLFSAGLSILFIPLGVTAGVVLAAIIHVVWNRVLFGRTSGS
jgi:hypothetical protein